MEGRSHFDLAHELFHVLTWDAMPPERLEEARETGGSRVEQLANSLAASVLMPVDARAVRPLVGAWEGGDDRAAERRGKRVARNGLGDAPATGTRPSLGAARRVFVRAIGVYTMRARRIARRLPRNRTRAGGFDLPYRNIHRDKGNTP